MGIIVIDPPPPPPRPPGLQRMTDDEWQGIWEYCFNVAQTALTPRYVFKPANTEGPGG